jgi:type IV pilus assembly protein PilM
MASAWLKGRRTPIGVDIGSRSVKLLQFDAAQSRVIAAARWDLPPQNGQAPLERDAQIVEALGRAREGRPFKGRGAVFCLGAGNLFVQNLRVAPSAGADLENVVRHEAAGRLPFASDEAEIRFLETADVRQGDSVRREVILLACHRPALERLLGIAEQAQLTPLAVDVEPTALLRCYARQFRRDDDQQRQVMFVNVGASNTTVLIARGADPMFVKYLDVGGRQLDEAVAKHLKMSLADAAALRRHNGDRRADQRDPEVTRSIAEASRPVLDHLLRELSLCLRYFSVTFRGQPPSQAVFGGGEANPSLIQWVQGRLDLPCELGDPLRVYEKSLPGGRVGQWDVAAGLALKEVK